MDKIKNYSRIFSLSLGTSPTEANTISENGSRLALLIENLSGNTVYIAKTGNADTLQAIQLDSGNIYENHTACMGKLYLWASVASSLVRVEEDCLQ